MRGLGCFYHEFCFPWTAAGTPQIGRVERLHLPSCSSRTPRLPQTPASASPSPDSTWEERALCLHPLSGPKTLTLIKSITSHLDQCDGHAQPSPCTLTLVDPSQFLHICRRDLSTTQPDLAIVVPRLVDTPKHAQERARCPVRGLPCPPQPFWLSALPVPVTLHQLVHSSPSCLWGGKLS